MFLIWEVHGNCVCWSFPVTTKASSRRRTQHAWPAKAWTYRPWTNRLLLRECRAEALHRYARGRPFICPVGVVVDFIPVRWRSQAAWLLDILEQEEVIECVDRGAPHKVGQKGTADLLALQIPNE